MSQVFSSKQKFTMAMNYVSRRFPPRDWTERMAAPEAARRITQRISEMDEATADEIRRDLLAILA